MRKTLAAVGVVLALAVSPWLRADRLPVRTFVKGPAYWVPRLSPDGKSLGFLSYVGDEDGSFELFVRDLASGSIARMRAPASDRITQNLAMTNFFWVNDHRLVFTPNFFGTAGAVDADGSHWRGLTGAYVTNLLVPMFASEVLHVFGGDSDSVLMLQRTEVNFTHPSVLEVNTVTGNTGVVADDSAGVTDWVADQEGNVRIGVKFDGADTSVIYRDNDQAGWRRLPDFDFHGQGSHPLAIDFDGKTAYVAGITPYGTWGIFSYDLSTSTRGPLVFADPTYDVINPNDFAAHAALVFSKAKRRLVGVIYTAEYTKTAWLDRDMASVQATLDRVLPGAANTVINGSSDDTRFLVQSWSDRHPGVFYIFDRRTGQLRKIFNSESWVNPSLMARMLPVKYKARDGLTIHGYLTVPRGAARRNLPLVVMPHGGPWVRDVLSYDPLVQFIANLGYAVLQVNYRGSPGYGEAFSEAGHRQIGKAVQNDITDGVLWAIQAGIADPRRVAILGISYGGYSAEWALANTPGLYRCGVAISGVSDWLSIINERDRREDERAAYRYWKEQIGDPETDEATLREISPINRVDRIRAPLFVVHSSHDPVVPVDQARRLVSALKERGLSYEEMFTSDPGHGYQCFGWKNRIALFSRIQAFLDRNMK
jgi:dipeptidyl aminopeptidase/acylaminoacyl peptidase